MTVQCSCCHLVTQDGGPDAPVSHGICRQCWPIYRIELGLKAAPYPGDREQWAAFLTRLARVAALVTQ